MPTHLQSAPRYKFPNTVGPKFVKPILPWVETFWHSKKRYPTDGELSAKFGLSIEQLMLLHNSRFYDKCLESRGITRNEHDLTPEQVAAISMITNFSDTRTTESKMVAIGVTNETLNGWYSNPTFQRELAARADSILDNVFPEAQAQLARQIKKGSFPALKFYYEITGRAQSPETINVRMAMNRLIEAVQRHIKDPEILQAIAYEMQSIPELSGSPTPVAAPQAQVTPAQVVQSEMTLAEKYQEFTSNE